MPDDPRPAMHATARVRVRYPECDPMGVAHHSVFPVWFEIARTELLRQQGLAYRDLEASGVLFVVINLSVRFRQPAWYDDELDIEVTQRPAAGVKVVHDYRVLRDRQLLAEGSTTLACLDANRRPRRIPTDMAATTSDNHGR
jgi:acyl-CoA thioester hydrolase